MKFSICNEVFQGWDWEATCRSVAEAGYDGIELAPFTLTADVRHLGAAERRDVRATAARTGLEIMGLHWLLVSPTGLSLTSPEASVRQATAEYLIALVDFCGDLGGTVMTLGSPKQRRNAEGDSLETTAARFLAGVRPALDRAQERGIVICLEPLPPPEANFLLTLAEAVELIHSLSHPAAKTNFDVKSASWENQPLPELFARYAPYIAHFHANDTNLRGPGSGVTDYRPLLSTMQKVGYAGYISVEPFDYSPDPETVAAQSLEYLRRCLHS
jgi:sugar phosphate isomerase/epimerase